MRCFKRAGFVIVTMILIFFIAYGGNVTFIPVAAAQSASEEAAKIAAEAAAKAKLAREKAEAERKEREAAAEQARKEAAVAAERARREAEERAAAEIARIDAEIAAQSARVAAVVAAERAREAEAAVEHESKEAEAAKAPPQRIGSDVLSARLIRQATPIYPPMARTARVSGVVVLDVLVDVGGNVTDITVKSGPALLRNAAIDAVRQWKYSSTLMNGIPIPVVGEVRVDFRLN